MGHISKFKLFFSLIIIAIFLFGCTSEKTTFPKQIQHIPTTPIETFNYWISLQKNKKYQEAWELVSKGMQNRDGVRGFHVALLDGGWEKTYDQFVEDKGLIDFGDESGDFIKLIEIINKWNVKEVNDHNAKYLTTVKYRDLTWNMELEMVKDNDLWLVDSLRANGYYPDGSELFWLE